MTIRPDGIDFAVHGDGYNTVDNPLISIAWLVPCVEDSSQRSPLEFAQETCDLEHHFNGVTNKIKITYGVLRSTGATICNVKHLSGKHFAILKRNLMLLGFHNETEMFGVSMILYQVISNFYYVLCIYGPS